jgi:hypothetical protein
MRKRWMQLQGKQSLNLLRLIRRRARRARDQKPKIHPASVRPQSRFANKVGAVPASCCPLLVPPAAARNGASSRPVNCIGGTALKFYDVPLSAFLAALAFCRVATSATSFWKSLRPRSESKSGSLSSSDSPQPALKASRREATAWSANLAASDVVTPNSRWLKPRPPPGHSDPD